MRGFLLGFGAFVLGGAVAVGMSLGGQAQTQPALAAVQRAEPRPGRLAVAATSAHEALAQGMLLHPVSTILQVPGRMQYGDYRWDESGVPQGPIWVRVDLGSQIISVFRSGQEIGTAVILYGADGLPTPTGRFPVLAKLKDHRSQTYDAPMPYTLRLTRDGISIHGSDVRWGYATHGCVGVPTAFAANLFDAVSVGDEILVVGRAGVSSRRA